MRNTVAILLAITGSPAFAITFNNTIAPSPIPEPGAIALFGIGAAAGLVILAKKRNKKK